MYYTVYLYYFSFLRECGREEPEPEVDYRDYEKMSKEGKELAQRLLPTLGEWTGQTLTVEQLREQVQREKDTKVRKPYVTVLFIILNCLYLKLV